MSIVSLKFFALFIIVFAVYYMLSKRGKVQNAWLLIVSYLFYGYCEWKVLPLLVTATVLFYVAGIAIAHDNGNNEKRASLWTTLSVVFGVGILVYFKYLNFLIDAVVSLLNLTGLELATTSLNIIMPLGISFFTFRLIAYPIEVHRGHMEPCRDFVAFASYVAFFPTILSGPIDRPKAFLDQLSQSRPFRYDYGVQGCKLILWGVFMKLCVADHLAILTSTVDENYKYLNAIHILQGSLLYPIQMYADFCGYSNVAIGLGLLLGIRVAENFNRPFFAKNVAEYWRRWHISLTGWLTDYVFMPLNVKFRDWGKFGIMLAIVINLVTVGMWHGANWTFAVFGLYHGLLFIPLILSGEFMKRPKKRKGTLLPSFKDVLKMVGTYLLVALGLVIFRAGNVSEAWGMIERIITMADGGELPRNPIDLVCYVVGIALLAFKDIKDEFFPGKLAMLDTRWCRWCIYVFLIALILSLGVLDGGDFIYMNF